MQQQKTRYGGLGRKVLSTIMAVVLAVGLIPLPAFGEGGVTAGFPAAGTDALAPVQVDYAAEDVEDSGITVPDDVAAMDFSTQRVIVSLGSGSLDGRDLDNVVSQGDGKYLLQYKNEEAAERAYVRYSERDGVDYVAPDAVFDAAAGDSQESGGSDATNPADAPLAMFSEGATADGESTGDGITIALIDTGAPVDDSHVIEYLSALSDGTLYDDSSNQHGSHMLKTMVAEDDGVSVVSIRSLDENGRGTAATVSRGIELAVERGVDVINLSLAAPAIDSNAAVDAAVLEAEQAGVVVVAAAGNAGKDASGYTPAGVKGVFTVGAAAEDGSRQIESNFGEAVDAYVFASSTSYAAARTSGWLSANGDNLDNWQDAFLESSLVSAIASGSDSASGKVITEEPGFKAAADITFKDGSNYFTTDAYGDENTFPEISAIDAAAEEESSTTWTAETDDSLTFVGWASEDDIASLDASDVVNVLNEDERTFSDVGGTKFYAVWSERDPVVFHTVDGDEDLENGVYRNYVRIGSAKVSYGFFDDGGGTQVPTTNLTPAGWNWLGWQTAKDSSLVSDELDLVKSLGTMEYWEVCERDLDVILGAVKGGKEAGKEKIDQTTSVKQSYKAVEDSPYSMDISDLNKEDFNDYLPPDQDKQIADEKNRWVLGGFQLSSTTNGDHSLGADFASKEDLAAGKVYVDDEGSDADKAKEVERVEKLLYSSTPPKVLTVYKRYLTLKKYRTESAYKDNLNEYILQYIPQFYCVGLNSELTSNSAASNPTINIEDPEGWPAGEVLDTWYYGSVKAQGQSATTLDYTQKWGATSTGLVQKVYATTKTDTTGYTVEFVDDSGNTVTTKRVEVGKTLKIADSDTPQALNPSWGGSNPVDYDFYGWALKDDDSSEPATKITKVTEVGEGETAGNVVKLQALYKQSINLHTYTASSKNTSKSSTNDKIYNRAEGFFGIELVAADSADYNGWKAVGWSTASTAAKSIDKTGLYTSSTDFTDLYAAYTRQVTLTYSHSSNSPAASAVTGWPSNDGKAQTYVSGADAPSHVTFTKPSNPSAADKDFQGWVESENGTSPIAWDENKIDKIPGLADSAALVLWDYWTDQASIYYVEFKDGTRSDKTTETPTSSATSLNGITPASFGWTAPTGCTDSDFAYWTLSTSDGFTRTNSVLPAGKRETITVQAVWNRGVTLTSGSGTGSDETATELYNPSISKAKLDLSTYTPVSLADYGWTTQGWTESTSSTSVLGSIYEGTSTHLYAYYTRAVTLTYDKNLATTDKGESSLSGTWPPDTSKQQSYHTTGTASKVTFDSLASIDDISLTDWKLEGWTNKSDGTSNVTKAEAQPSPTEGTTTGFTTSVYARWSLDRNAYIVRYVDGTNMDSTTNPPVGTEATLDKKPSDFGWTAPDNCEFAYWALPSDPLTKVEKVGKTAAKGEPIVVQAVYNRKAKLISGENAAEVEKTQLYNPTANKAQLDLTGATPTTISLWKTQGWTDSTTSTTLVGTTYTGLSDKLYGYYTRDVTLTYDKNAPSGVDPTTIGGTWPRNETKQQVYHSSLENPEKVTFSSLASTAGPTLTDWLLDFWTGTADGTEEVKSVETQPALKSANTTAKVYAHWKVDKNVYYVKYTNGTDSDATTEVAVADTFTLNKKPSDFSDWTIPANSEFAYWALATGDPLTEVTEVGPSGKQTTVEVQAVWLRDVALVSGSGSGTTTTLSKAQYYNQTAQAAKLDLGGAVPAEFTRWTADGWTDSTSSVTPNVSDTYTGVSDRLYGVYKRDIVLTYEKNVPEGESADSVTGSWPAQKTTEQRYRTGGSPSAQPFTLDQPSDLGLAGYEFKGWVTTATGTTPVTTLSANPGMTADATATVYAYWTVDPSDTSQKVRYTVNHHKQSLNGGYETTTSTPLGTVGQSYTVKANTYEGFTPDRESSQITVTSSTAPIDFYYTRNVNNITASKVTASTGSLSFEFEISAEHAKKMSTTDGTGSATAVYGDTVTVKPTKKIPEGYVVNYSWTGVNASNVKVDSKYAATFEMPDAPVTLTATAALDPNYSTIEVVSYTGIDASGVGGDVPSTARKGSLVLLVATAQDGYSLVDDPEWTVEGVPASAIVANEAGFLAFRMPDTAVKATAPSALKVFVKNVTDTSGNTTTTTTTSVYGPDGWTSTVESGGKTTYEKTTVVADADNPKATTTTTETYANSSLTGDPVSTKVVRDDGAGTVTTTTGSGRVVEETVSTGAGKTRTTVTEYNAAGVELNTEWEKVTETTQETGRTVAVTTSTKTDTTTTGSRTNPTLASPYVVTDKDTTVTSVAITTSDGATTTTEQTADATEEISTVTTHPVEWTIGGTKHSDATRVERSGQPAQYYRAQLTGSDAAGWKAAYASDDTDVAVADATISSTRDGATVNLAVTPKGGTKVSGTSTTVLGNSGVASLYAQTNGVTVSLSGKRLAKLNTTKYWYALVVKELGTKEYSTLEKSLLKSDEHYAKIAYDNRIFAVSLYRIAKDVDGVVAGTVSELPSSMTADLAVAFELGAANAKRQAYVTRVSGDDAVAVGYRTADDKGKLAAAAAGGLGDFIVGIGVKFTATYHDNYERSDGSIPQTAAKPWSDVENWSTQPNGQFERKYYALDSWNTENDGTGKRYEAGKEGTPQGGPLTEDIDLYAQWKADLAQTNVANASEGTHVTLYSDAARTKAYGTPTYNGKDQHPYVKVTFNGATLTEGVDYTLTYLNSAGKAVAANTVVGAGSYKVTVTGIEGTTSAAAAGTGQTVAFSIGKATQTLTVPTRSYTKTYGDAAFSVSGGVKAAGIAGGSAAGAVSYATGNKEYATVNSGNGLVTIVMSTTGTKKTTDGTVKINVTAAETANYKAVTIPISVTINQASRTITGTKTYSKAVGDKAFKLNVKLSDSEGTIVYTANNSARAQVDKTGKVTIKGNGPAWFTMTCAATPNYKAAEQFEACVAINKLKVTAKAPKVKVAKVKKKAQTVVGMKIAKYKGTATYKKTKGNKNFTVNKKNGKITIKKGTKKGTYTLKIKVTLKKSTAKVKNAAGKAKNYKVTYKALTKTATVKVKVVK